MATALWSATSWKSQKTVSGSVWFSINQAPVSPLTMHIAQKLMHSLFFVFFKGNIVILYALEAHLLHLLLYYISIVSLKLAVVSSFTLCNQYNSIATPMCFLVNDQGNLIVLMSNVLIFRSLDKIKEVGMLSPIESKLFSHFSSMLRLTEKMTTH